MANLLTYAHLPLKISNPVVRSSAFPSSRNVVVKASAVTLPEKKTRRRKKQQKEEERGAGSGAEKGLRLVFMQELMERARSRDVAGVSEVIYDMIAAGLSPGPRSFHGLIVSHALNGDDQGAMHALRRELSEGLRPLHETFVALIRLFGSKGLSTRGLEVLAAMEKLNFDIRQAWLILVEELVRSNHLEDANKVFLKGAEGGLRGTDEIYDLLIEEDCKAGDHSNALTIAYEMEAAGRMATTSHFNFLLSVQATCGIPEIAFATFENMEYGEDFMKPNTETYNWVIQAYTRAESYDRVQDVAELLGMMVEDHKRVQPNVQTYALLVECFTKYCVIGEAIRHFRALKNFEGGTKILHAEGQHGDPLSLYLRALCKEGRIVELLEALEAMAKDNQPIPPRAMILSRKYRSLVSSWIEPLQEEAELGYEIDYIERYIAEGGLTGDRKRWVPRRGKTPLDPDAFGFIYNSPMETSFKQRCLEDWKIYHRKVLRILRNEGPSVLGEVSESDYIRVEEWLKKSIKGPDQNALKPKAASKMIVSELREELEAQGLPTDGTRNVLYQRVQKARRINRSRGRPLWVPPVEEEEEEFDAEIDELVSRVKLNEGNTEFWKRRFLGEGIKSDNGNTIDVKISEPRDELDNDNVDDVNKEGDDADEADEEEDDEDEEEEEEVEVEVEESESEAVDRRVKDKEAEAEKPLQMIGLQLLKDSDEITTTSKKSRRKVSLMAMEAWWIASPPRPCNFISVERQYLMVNHIGAIRAEHDDFTIRFASAMNQLVLLKSMDGADIEWCKEVKGNMYDMVVEGFQLLSRWTARIWEQCAWKFSHPCRDPLPTDSSLPLSDYEKVVRYNYTSEERKALVELVSYIKSIGSMLQRCDTLVADALWETIHTEVQDFVQNTLATMLRTTFRKKKDLSRILSDMRTLSADWMANTSKPESEFQSSNHGGEESRGNFFYPRPVAPTTSQVHCLQFLIYEVVSGGNLRKPGGLFGNSGSEIPATDLKQLETFFYKLSFFLHILDYSVTVASLTDLGFLWFREFYLESSRVIQFPIECSLPWMLVDHVIDLQNAGLLESVLMPFDIYNDSAQHALVVLKQRFLYDEIEAEVDNCFDIFVAKLCETLFTHYKSWAASELLDPSFLFALDSGEKFTTRPMRFTALLKMTRVKLLGRTINLRSLIAGRMNKVFRENIEFLFDRFESQDLCAVVELDKLLGILRLAHELLSKDLSIDSFSLMLNEMQENISLVSYSSRLASQIWTEMQNDFLPNFILCNTTQRFVRSSKVPLVPVQKPSVPYAKPYFYCGTQDLNSAHQNFARLHNAFFGLPHMFSIVRLLGSRSLPWLIRALLDHISNKITTLEPLITGLQDALPKSIGLLPFDGGVTGCKRLIKEHLKWQSKSEVKAEVIRGIKEIGSVLYWMGLLDIVLREVDTTHFMQTAPWLGLVPGEDGQILQSQEGGDSPIVTLFKSAASAAASNPGRSNPTSFLTIARQAEAADLLYKANINTGSVLEYALAFTSAALDKYCSKWSAAPKTGFVDITTSKDFYRIFSGLQIEYLEESIQVAPSNHEVVGDSVAWGGCTIIYLLGQQLHFELFDFSYQVLNVAEAEAEAAAITPSHKNPHSLQGWEGLLEAMKKARRLNNHVFSMLKGRCPLEDKQACAIKQSGAPLHRIKFENTVSAFETLPQKALA